jgi:hypothetical protein
MKIISLLAIIALSAMPAITAEPDSRVYELRIDTAAPGKLDALNTRFRDHAHALFEKHKIENLGYWMPIENTANQLIYVVSFSSREARKAAWEAFGKDPDWKKAKTESEKDGFLTSKVESLLMSATDYSPKIAPSQGTEDRVFELRTYTTPPGRLDALHGRFRNHTVGLFAKHGMSNLFYWKLQPDQAGADVTLIYLLAHQSVDAAKASFTAFRADPEWIAAKAASEKAAGGSLTVDKDGVKSLFLKATDYSPTK